ncbi:hypothetical protein [Mesorhizobium sp. M0674]|uniref:hypothetical protein n=1 Tax=unclassified Mesorhizobium TaxID=325217 RepID=UPI0033365A0F
MKPWWQPSWRRWSRCAWPQRSRRPSEAAAHLVLRWKGGALSRLTVALPRSRPATVRTDEDTLALLRRLAPHYPDAVIAGIINRQGRRTAYDHRLDANRVGNLRRHWNIPVCKAKPAAVDGDIVPVRQAAAALGVAPSTLHRHLNDGLIQGEQINPGSPWRIRLTTELKARFLATPGDGFEPIRDAMKTLGCRAKVCCSGSSAANWAPSMSSVDREKGL